VLQPRTLSPRLRSPATVVWMKSSHQRAAHPHKPGVVGKAARKPPPPPECFLVHFGSVSGVTASDEDAPANRRAREAKPRVVHWYQWLPPLVAIQVQHLARRRACTNVKFGHSSKDGKAAVAQNTPTATKPYDAHARQLPPPPASRTRQRRLIWQLLQHLRRHAL
jgi:hypothetical protein